MEQPCFLTLADILRSQPLNIILLCGSMASGYEIEVKERGYLIVRPTYMIVVAHGFYKR